MRLSIFGWAAFWCAVLHAAPAGGAPQLRLGDSVRPTHYAVELTLEPGKDTFSGVVDIDVDVRDPRDTVWLNAVSLDIHQATIGAKAAKIIPGNTQVIGLSTGQTLPAGPTRLRIAYDGRISKNSSAGIFELREDDRWYLYTQFEPTDARRAFPCFDEPAFKTPWDLALRVPKPFLAVANTPQTAESPSGDGMKLVRFATSRPLPSYLVAVGVGPFEAVDLGKVGRRHTPMRLIVPHGKTAEARYAAEAVPQLFKRLEDYFGMPYPYAKLDSLVMPISDFAMENAGLITYGESLLLSEAENDTIDRQRDCAVTTAHEMAHQWFGDLVTTAWWDDIWLNEAFATWLESKITGEWQPDWRMDASDVDDRLGAMHTDGLVTTRRIRQPIASDDDIANAFDDITYQKGAAVIRMFERWIGSAKFRGGVQLYLKQNADGAATASQFLAAIGTAAGKDVAPAFSTFLDQAGVPVVSMELQCSGPQPQLALSQKRYLPIGSPGSPDQGWRIPVCVKFEAGGKVRNQCELLADPRSRMTLEGTRSCPAWVMGNDGGNGYYRVAYTPATLERLLAGGVDHLSLAEKIGFLGDVSALVDSGDVQASGALPLARRFAGAPEHEIVDATKDIAKLAIGRYVPAELLPKGRKFIRDLYGERAARLGWKAPAGESDDDWMLRQALVPFVATEGRAQPLIDQARQLAREWLNNHSAVDPGMVQAVLSTAAMAGDRAYFDSLAKALEGEKDHKSRQAIFGALGSFQDPELARAGMQLFLTGSYDTRESFYALLFGPLKYRGTATLPFTFVKANVDRILARLPREVGEDFAASLPSLGGGFCDASGRAQVEQFFEDRVKEYTGGPRRLAQVLESIDLCIARSRVVSPSVSGFLRSY